MTEKIRILVVEDDDRTSELLGAMLTHAGYEVAYASNGEEALRVAHQQKFETILMDIFMPEMDGEEAARTLTRHHKDKTPIIAVTARKIGPGRLSYIWE